MATRGSAAHRLCSSRNARARVDFVHLLELGGELRQALAQHRAVDQDAVVGDQGELPGNREPLRGHPPARVAFLAQTAEADEVVDGPRQRGVPAREPALERIGFPVAAAQRHDVADVYVDVADAGVASAEEQGRKQRRAERLPGSETLGDLRACAPAIFRNCTLNDHRSPPGPGPFYCKSAFEITSRWISDVPS